MDWQTIVSLCVVFGSMLFVVRKLYRSTNGSVSGCGTGCSTCPASHPQQGLKQVSLVQIDDESVVS